jgi:hypothetical protein
MALLYAVYGLSRESTNISAVYSLVAVIAVIFLGIHYMLGRPAYRRWISRHTYYLVTDSRLVVRRNFGRRRLLSMDLRSVSNMRKSVRPNGVGTITFSGLTSSGAHETGVFANVKDADRLYDYIYEALRKQEKTNISVGHTLEVGG